MTKVTDKTNCTIHTFKKRGKWYTEGRGYAPEEIWNSGMCGENSHTRKLLLEANDGQMPGLSTKGEEYFVVVLLDEPMEFGWPLLLHPV